MTVSDVTPQQASDARQGPRVNVSWAARVVVGPQSYLEARVINVSADGLALVCEHAFQSGAVLQVLIALPDFQDHSKYQYPTVQLLVAGTEGVNYNIVEVYISRLRSKLETAGIRIRTVRGLGYMLEDYRAM